MLALQFFSLAFLLLVLFFVDLSLSLMEVLDTFNHVVLHDGDALDFLDLATFYADGYAGENGNETAQYNEQRCSPGGSSESVEVPHEDAQTHLKRCVEHVHPYIEIQGPGLGGWGPYSRKWCCRHRCGGQRDCRVRFELGNLFFGIRWW